MERVFKKQFIVRISIIFFIGVALSGYSLITTRAVHAASVVGYLEESDYKPGGVNIRGWTMKANDTGSIKVHVYGGEDGLPRTGTYRGGLKADVSRNDLSSLGNGTAHGYKGLITLDDSDKIVCAYGVASDANRKLGCTAVDMKHMRGNIEVVAQKLESWKVIGWAADPDTDTPVNVHAYTSDTPYNGPDGSNFLGGTYANKIRNDVAASTNYSASHGINFVLPGAPSGTTKICFFALNANGTQGTSTLLNKSSNQDSIYPEQVKEKSNLGENCRVHNKTHIPVGYYDEFKKVDADSVKIAGWTFDPDTVDPISVHLYEDKLATPSKFLGGMEANLTRSDLAEFNGAFDTYYTSNGTPFDGGKLLFGRFNGYGKDHGFSATINMSTQPKDVCAFAVNKDGSAGKSRLLGCLFSFNP